MQQGGYPLEQLPQFTSHLGTSQKQEGPCIERQKVFFLTLHCSSQGQAIHRRPGVGTSLPAESGAGCPQIPGRSPVKNTQGLRDCHCQGGWFCSDYTTGSHWYGLGSSVCDVGDWPASTPWYRLVCACLGGAEEAENREQSTLSSDSPT